MLRKETEIILVINDYMTDSNTNGLIILNLELIELKEIGYVNIFSFSLFPNFFMLNIITSVTSTKEFIISIFA